MSWKERLRKYEWILIPLVLAVGSFFGGSYCGQQKVLASIESKSDTITKIVPVYKDFPEPVKTARLGYVAVPTYKFLSDTITTVETAYLHDTTVVYLPREQKYYEEADGKLRLWVSGYNPRLDRYELDLPQTIITNTVKVTNPKWAFLLNGGFETEVIGKSILLYPFIETGVLYESRFEMTAGFGCGAFFNNNNVAPGTIVSAKFKYAFLRL